MNLNRRYIVMRFLQMIPLIFSVIILNFMLIHATPGDPARIIFGEFMSGGAGSGEDEARILAAIREQWGLNEPLHVQLWIYITQMLSGNLGYSYRIHQPVTTIIAQRIMPTLILIIPSILLGMILGLLLGVYSGKKHPSAFSSIVEFISMIGYSIPTFWLALVFILVFSVNLNWFPMMGMQNPLDGSMLDRLWHLCLPVATLTFGWTMPSFMRLSKASVIEVSREDYVKCAQAEGLKNRVIFYKYVLRNSLLPVVTLTGIWIGVMFTGAIMVETVFSWPGLGRTMFDAAIARDYPLLMGVFLIISVCVVITSFATDIVIAILDPRIGYEKRYD